MKNSPLKLAFAVFGIAVAIFLSCSSGPPLEFPAKDEPIAPSSSSSAVSSSSAESSSSEKIYSSSSNGEVSSSSEPSSSSEESSSSFSSSSESSSSAESSSSTLPTECNSTPYDPLTQGCCKNTIYPLKRTHYGKEKEQFCDERDGKTYVKVVIGTGATAQTWMAENLNYKTEDGLSRCHSVSGSDADNANCTKYGRLYNWASAMSIAQSYNTTPFTASEKHKGICPSGWHLSSDAEWETLINYAGGATAALAKLKATSEWNTYNGVPASTDEFGFSLLPSGAYSTQSGSYVDIGTTGVWWTTTTIADASIAYRRNIDYNISYIGHTTREKTFLFAVRCVKDNL